MALVMTVIAAGVLAAGIWSYNRQIALRNLMQEALSGIDVQLKRRHDLVPNLVEIVKSYSQYEKHLLEQVTQARTRAGGTQGPLQRLPLEMELARSLRGLLAVVEKYPDLKADGQFLALQSSLVKVEDELQMARRYYNGTVRDLNICIRSVPGNIIAAIFHFQPAEFFEIEYATERSVPDVTFASQVGSNAT